MNYFFFKFFFLIVAYVDHYCAFSMHGEHEDLFEHISYYSSKRLIMVALVLLYPQNIRRAYRMDVVSSFPSSRSSLQSFSLVLVGG
jgi:hypothetical protein